MMYTEHVMGRTYITQVCNKQVEARNPSFRLHVKESAKEPI
jgi:hypothetical protein